MKTPSQLSALAALGLGLQTAACSPTTAKIGAGEIKEDIMDIIDTGTSDGTDDYEPEVDYRSPDGDCELGGIVMSEHPGEPWVVPTSELEEFLPGEFPVTNGLLTLGFNYWRGESDCEGLEFGVEVNGEAVSAFTFQAPEVGNPRLFIKRIAIPPSDEASVQLSVYTPEGDLLLDEEADTRISSQLTAPHWLHMLYQRLDELPPEIDYEDSNYEATIPTGAYNGEAIYTVNDSDSHLASTKKYLYDADLYGKDASWLTALYNPDDYWDEDPLLRWQAAVAATQVLGLTHIEGIETDTCNDIADFATEPYAESVLAFAQFAPSIAMDAYGNCIPEQALVVSDMFSVEPETTQLVDKLQVAIESR